VAAAFGGISLITVDYPHARHQALAPSEATLAELDRRLITVWLGRAHESSSMHDEVIARLSSHESPKALERIRAAARLAAEALMDDDLDTYATALVENNDALDGLHSELVSEDARGLIELARSHAATGWKVLGAGGAGGSIVVLGSADRGQCTHLREAIDAHSRWRCVHASIARDGVIARRSAPVQHRAAP
jgi:galactokinase/mevalonate kinase-like predicted kinase